MDFGPEGGEKGGEVACAPLPAAEAPAPPDGIPKPDQAADETARLLPFAREPVPGAPFGAIGFILRKP